MNIKGRAVKGLQVDPLTRCTHYHSERDIIAIKFKCCQTYYPCYKCHDALCDHTGIKWESGEFGEKAVLCGQCGSELTIKEYLHAHSTCPYCHAQFNPGCGLHYNYYFEIVDSNL